MTEKKKYGMLLGCYLMWGFQPLYWGLLDTVDSITILCARIVFAAVFSAAILAATGKLPQLWALFRDKNAMKRTLPAVVFLLADWAVFIIVVQNGHILDASLGYYINPLVLFALGIIIYQEKCTKPQLAALLVAAAGVVVSTVSLGTFPMISLVVAVNWAFYAAIKKSVKADGVVSIAAETIILTPLAIAFALVFRRPELAALKGENILFLVGSGIVTALPMFLYSYSVATFPLILMCFAQYLSPTFNLICGFIRGERFTPSQLVSFAFFLVAIVIFTVTEAKKVKTEKTNRE